MSYLEESLQCALDHFQAGRMSEAASTCQTILESDPDNAAALNLMAVITVELGQTDTAINLAERTVALRPDVPVYYNALGVALSQSTGRPRPRRFFKRHWPCRRAMPASAPVWQTISVARPARSRTFGTAASDRSPRWAAGIVFESLQYLT